MFGSELLDIAVGFSLVFLLLSLAVTATTESVSQIFALRSRTLIDGLKVLLDGDEEAVQGLMDKPLIRTLYRTSWADELIGRAGRPSYLPGKTFARTVVSMVREAASGGVAEGVAELRAGLNNGGNLPKKTRDALDTMLGEVERTSKSAGEQVQAFQDAVEDWFDETMARASGWYKRRTQYIVFVLAILVVVFLNADALVLGDRLMVDDELRTAVADAAVRYVEEQDPGNLESAASGAQSELTSLGLPLGWNHGFEELPDHDNFFAHFKDRFWYGKALGLFISVMAVQLGAPFWFDMLSRLVKLRASGILPKARSEQEPAGGASTADVTSAVAAGVASALAAGAASGAPGAGTSGGTA